MADASGNEIVVASEAPAQLPASPATPMELLSRALDRGADLEMVEKLMDLAERQERNMAKKAFDAAVAEAKSQIKPVVKNRKGNNSKYADLSAYAKEVDPILATHGLSYRYNSRQEGATIYITCVLSHRDGHSVETTLSAAPDTSGSKNAIQAIGSTVEYLKRYTLTLALGLSSSEADDDGQAAGGDAPISEEQLATLRSMIDDTNADAAKLCDTLRIDALPDLPASRFKEAEKLLIERKRLIEQRGKKNAGAPK